MSAEWPSTLPSAFVLGHTDQPQVQVAAFEPAVGAPLLYQVGDSRARSFSGKARISDAQRLIFLDFFQTTLAGGSRRFELESASFDGERWLCQFDATGPYRLEGAAAGWWLEVALVLVRRLS